MKKVLFIILCVLEILWISTVSFEFFLRAIPNDFTRKLHSFEKVKDEVEILILGSSHTYVGLNPTFFDQKTFNLAYSSQSIDLDAKIWDRVKSQLPRLKTIIIPISYFSYGYALEDGNSAHKIKNYNIYYSIYSHTFQVENQLEILNQSIQRNGQRLNRASKNTEAFVFVDHNGFNDRRIPKKEIDWEKSAAHAVQNHTQNLKDDKIKTRIRMHVNLLEEMMQWSAKRGIKILLISTPVTHFYYSRINPQQLDHWRRITLDLSTKYKHVEWLNYFENDSIFTTQDFQDADHLNKNGAAKLSLLVNQFINQSN